MQAFSPMAFIYSLLNVTKNKIRLLTKSITHLLDCLLSY